MSMKEHPKSEKKDLPVVNHSSKDASNTQGYIRIIGIGASAGGLEALEIFFSTMPSQTNLAFVIIQHLSPKHKSTMVEILSRFTKMKVEVIKDGIQVQPNHIYLNPPEKNVTLFKRTFHLLDPIREGSINLPIDFFFRSLSKNEKERAVAIVVSGTASDGTLGIKSVKEQGGMVMVQDPDDAKYSGMPQNAIKTGIVDFILPVQDMPKQLINFIKHPAMIPSCHLNLTESNTQNQFQKIFSMIRSATGHDFSQYKQSTIQRRIERRLAVHQIDRLSNYVKFLQENAKEIDILFKNLIIGVTSFFRDPEAFKLIEKKILPQLLKGKGPDNILRIWVTGCATGEEAYTIAILVSEAMKNLHRQCQVQIFATDIDDVAIEEARRGIYLKNIVRDLSQERLNEFFIKEESGFRIKKHIRDMIVFSQQSIIKDPPFSKLDLVICRNLMIYLNSLLQKKLIPLFHYTLNPEGILMLGTSESVGEFTDYFQAVSTKWKIFKRKGIFLAKDAIYPAKISFGGEGNFETNTPQKLPEVTDVQALAERMIMDDFAPSGILINEKYEILHFVGNTDKYLMPPKGKPTFDLLKIAREGLKHKLIAILHKANREKKRVTSKGVQIKLNDSTCVVDISVSPLMGSVHPPGYMMVIFDDKAPDFLKKTLPGESDSNTSVPEVKLLEHELQSTREYLQATIEELETSNEELKSTNEELQSVNEELQSTNEELETSKEELQSTNEELATVNSELQNKVDQLFKASDDMNNLLAATEIASIFLDSNLCIKRYTPAAAKIVKLIATDIGRPLGDLKTSFPDFDLVCHGQKVLHDLNTLEMEILSEDKNWYALKILPYRTIENFIDGVVMTLIDIQAMKQTEKIRRFATVLEDSNDAITVHDLKGQITAWNKGAEKMYGWTEAEALNMNMKKLFPKNKQNEPKVLVDKIKKNITIKSFKSERINKRGELLDIWLTVTALRDEKGNPIEIGSTERNLAWLTTND